MKVRWVLKGLKMVLLFIVGSLVIGLVVMILWNGLVPDLFKGPGITFWQSVELLVLSHILLRGWGRWRYTNGWHRDRWRHRFEEKLEAMTPEEREKFKQEWGRRFGWESGKGQDAKGA